MVRPVQRITVVLSVSSSVRSVECGHSLFKDYPYLCVLRIAQDCKQLSVDVWEWGRGWECTKTIPLSVIRFVA